MTTEPEPATPAIGGCLRCNQLFLVTDTIARCLGCGRLPDLTLPFGHFEPAGEDVQLVAPPAADKLVFPSYFSLACPHCHASLQVYVSDREVSLLFLSAAPPAEEAAAQEIAPSPAASPPVEPEPAPTMATDVFGQPIEGPPEPAEPPAPEEPPA